jgi:hypothetical protein
MKLRPLLVITAAMYVGSGIVAVVAPAKQLSLYGVAETPAATFMAQWAGLGSIVVGLLAWSARGFGMPEARRPLLLTLLAYFIVAGVLSLVGTVSGVMSGVGWVLLIVNVLFAGCWAYFLISTARSKGT